MNERERELDRQWSRRYTQDVRRLEQERDAANERAAALRSALDDAIRRLERAGDKQVVDLLRVLDG